MVEVVKRVLGSDDNDVDVLVVVVVITVVSLSEGVMVLALIIAKDAVDCVSIVEIIPEPVWEVDVISGVVEDVKIVE